MSDIREKQNQRRRESGERPTIDSMIRDLAEEMEDENLDEEQRKKLQDLLDLEKKTRLP